MNQNKIPILVLRLVWMRLLDDEVESRMVAIPVRDDQDATATAERLAEEHGAVLLHVQELGRATLHIED